MVRRSNFYGSPKTITAATAQTLSWTNSEVASERVIAYHFSLNGDSAATNTLADVDRIRIMANGVNIINITPTQLRAYLQAFSHGRIQLETGAQTFSVPLAMIDAATPDQQDLSQFPSRSQVQIDLLMNTGTIAGYALVGWTETSIEPMFYPRILSSNANIPASSGTSRFVFQENGIVRGISLPQTGIDRLKIALGNVEYVNLAGDGFQGETTEANTGNLAAQAEEIWLNSPHIPDTALQTEIFHRLNAGTPAPIEGSFVELVTNSDWAGAANEACVYALAPNGAQAQQAA